mmetsp:Transcript_114593/g.228050  ORF Transcript_114593/g.228050 Transcript_114593/m.228050 type:complete len:209 (+) Transcript_114593:672-1298(+)
MYGFLPQFLTYIASVPLCPVRGATCLRSRSGKKTASASTLTTQSCIHKRPSCSMASKTFMNNLVLSHELVVCPGIATLPLVITTFGTGRVWNVVLPATPKAIWPPLLNTTWSLQPKIPARLMKCDLINASSGPCGITRAKQKRLGNLGVCGSVMAVLVVLVAVVVAIVVVVVVVAVVAVLVIAVTSTCASESKEGPGDDVLLVGTLAF